MLETFNLWSWRLKRHSLPIRQNRTCWKLLIDRGQGRNLRQTYRLGKIGLVGNRLLQQALQPDPDPYRLGKIGLVGNQKLQLKGSSKTNPYRLGKIGLVGNAFSSSSARVAFHLPIRQNRTCWKPAVPAPKRADWLVLTD